MRTPKLAAGVVAVLIALVSTAQAQAPINGYSGRFVVRTNPHTFGQAPAYLPDGRVVSNEDLAKGDGTQLYVSKLDGSSPKCLSCGQKAPNMVPQPRPQGDWILYHTWRDHHLTIGAPGFGGMGSALSVMRPDGSKVTPLTGIDATRGAGEGEDDYHAYWSPDGKRVVWTHLNWNFATDGGQGKWDVRVADFVDDAKGPRLTNERVVRPANGHWYETQWWAPDGSGFLYTETAGTSMNTELFFCRLSRAGCKSEQLTRSPGWDEQAVFTPDMKNIIFMSTRDHPGLYNTYSQLAQTAGLTPDQDYLLTLPIFEGGFLQPIGGEYTDLYELNLHTRSVRRLTTDGDQGWIIPEFTWDPSKKHLMWTELRFRDGVRTTVPPDPGQLQQLVGLLSNPPSPDISVTDLGAVQGKSLEKRTRIAAFK